MKKNTSIYLLVCLLFLLTSGKPGWTPLFNGKDLKNWDKYIGTALKGKENLHQNATTDNVFSVVKQNGEKVIKISGEVNGALATKESFENYHLQIIFKWGDKIHTRQNSGLLYHSFGEFGDALGTWMTNIEFQLMHDNLGDTYLMNNTTCETLVINIGDSSNFAYNHKGVKKLFGRDFTGKSIKKADDAEKPLGEWNAVDLFCFGRTAVHVVNGKTVMINNNCGINSENGIEPLTSGKIQLQSEGAELVIKSIKIRSIERIPKKVLK